MKSYLKFAFLSAVLGTVLISAPGCGKTASEEQSKGIEGPVTLKLAWWGNDQRREMTEKVVQLFQQKNPSIKIQTASFAGTEPLTTDLAMKAVDEDLPDIIQTDYNFMSQYASRKLIAPLDSYVKDGILNLKDVDPSYTESGKSSGQLYGVTLAINVASMAYDPAVFEKAGVPVPPPEYTFDDLHQTALSLKAKIKDKDFYPLANLPDFAYYLRGKGASYYNKDGTALGYDDDQYFIEYVTMLKKWKEEGLIAPSPTTSGNELLIARGKAAFYHTTSNQVSTISKNAGHLIKILPPPAVAAGQEAKFIKPSMFFSMSDYSKHKEAAAKFIDFFINDPDANDILSGERGVPVSSKIKDRLTAKLNDADKEQYAIIDYVKSHSKPIDPPSPKASVNVTAVYNIESDYLISGQKAPEAAAKDFRTGANNILSGNMGRGN